MGDRGPSGKRSDMKNGHRTKAELGEITKGSAGAEIVWFDAPADWQELTRYMYEGIQVSGETKYFEQSDVVAVRYLLENVDISIRPYEKMSDGKTVLDDSGKPIMVVPKPNSNLVSAIMSGLGNLGLTEGDRRRMKMELVRDSGPNEDQENASSVVVSMKDRLADRASSE